MTGPAAVSSVNTILTALRNANKPLFRSVFPFPLSLILTDHKILQAFDLITFMLGPLESWSAPLLHQPGRFVSSYKVRCKFQRSHQALVFSLWGSKVVGLSLGTPMDLGLVPAWTAPEYVDAERFTEEEITVRPSWVLPAIGGSLTLPKAEGRKPAVLLIPRSGPIDRDETFGGGKTFKDLAWGLASQGIVVLRMDKPTMLVLLKQMVTRDLTLVDEYITPGVAALRFLAGHEEVDPKRIFLLGHSLGGCVVPRLAKVSPVPIAGVISAAGSDGRLANTIARQMRLLNEWFPREDPKQHEKEMAQYDAVVRVVEAGGPKPGESDPTKELAVPIPMTYLLDCAKYNPVEIVKELDIPMLSLQGRADWQVSMHDEYATWQRGLEGWQKVEWKEYDNVGHMLTVNKDAQLKGNFAYDAPQNVEGDIIMDVVDWVRKIGGGADP